MLCLMEKCLCSHRNRCSSCHSWGIHSAINPPGRPEEHQSFTNATKNLRKNFHVLPAPGVYPVVLHECLNVNTNSCISKINKENLPLQRRRKMVCFLFWIFLLFGWLAFVVCFFFFPWTMITSRQPTHQQIFGKSVAKQQQWLNFQCSTLRSGLFCPIRNKSGVMEPTRGIPGFPELPSLKTQLSQSLTPPFTLDLVSSNIPELRWMQHSSCLSFSSYNVYLTTVLFMQRYQGW